jgi:hypothetical protein
MKAGMNANGNHKNKGNVTGEQGRSMTERLTII